MIVLSHGHFDLLHYGHLKHLQEAAKLGTLVVSLTAGKYMTKPGHPIFTDGQRKEMLEALRCVDKVIIVEDPGPYKAINLIRPDIYVKGLEYRMSLQEKQYCEDSNIRVVFLGEKIFGSTRLKSLLPSS